MNLINGWQYPDITKYNMILKCQTKNIWIMTLVKKSNYNNSNNENVKKKYIIIKSINQTKIDITKPIKKISNV